MTENYKDDQPILECLRAHFRRCAAENYSYMMVFGKGWSEQPFAVLPVPRGSNPWAAHDAFLENHSEASFLAIAFDLSKPFSHQIPAHLHGMSSLECFAFTPKINIPDRQGHVPEDRARLALFPPLRLVVDNG